MRISRGVVVGKILRPMVAELSALATSGLVGDSETTGYGIGQPRVGQSSGITPLSPEAVLHFSWTHILELIRIDDTLVLLAGSATIPTEFQLTVREL